MRLTAANWHAPLRPALVRIALLNAGFVLFMLLAYAARRIVEVDLAGHTLAIGALYLPHAITMLGAWLLGWRLPLYALPVILCWFCPVEGLREAGLVFLSFVVAVLARDAVRLACTRAPATPHAPLTWRCVLASGLLAAAIGAAISQLVFSFHGPAQRLEAAAAIFTTMSLGLVAGLLILMCAFRIAYRYNTPRILLDPTDEA